MNTAISQQYNTIGSNIPDDTLKINPETLSKMIHTATDASSIHTIIRNTIQQVRFIENPADFWATYFSEGNTWIVDVIEKGAEGSIYEVKELLFDIIGSINKSEDRDFLYQQLKSHIAFATENKHFVSRILLCSSSPAISYIDSSIMIAQLLDTDFYDFLYKFLNIENLYKLRENDKSVVISSIRSFEPHDVVTRLFYSIYTNYYKLLTDSFSNPKHDGEFAAKDQIKPFIDNEKFLRKFAYIYSQTFVENPTFSQLHDFHNLYWSLDALIRNNKRMKVKNPIDIEKACEAAANEIHGILYTILEQFMQNSSEIFLMRLINDSTRGKTAFIRNIDANMFKIIFINTSREWQVELENLILKSGYYLKSNVFFNAVIYCDTNDITYENYLIGLKTFKDHPKLLNEFISSTAALISANMAINSDQMTHEVINMLQIVEMVGINHFLNEPTMLQVFADYLRNILDKLISQNDKYEESKFFGEFILRHADTLEFRIPDIYSPEVTRIITWFKLKYLKFNSLN